MEKKDQEVKKDVKSVVKQTDQTEPKPQPINVFKNNRYIRGEVFAFCDC